MPAVNRERKHNSNPMGKRKHWYLPCIAPALAALLLAGCGATVDLNEQATAETAVAVQWVPNGSVYATAAEELEYWSTAQKLESALAATRETAPSVDLNELLDEFCAAQPGSFSLYLQNPATGESYTYNTDALYYPASLLKLPYAFWLCGQADAGTLDLEDELPNQFRGRLSDTALQAYNDAETIPAKAAMRAMIAHSDNNAVTLLTTHWPANESSGFQQFLADYGFAYAATCDLTPQTGIIGMASTGEFANIVSAVYDYLDSGSAAAAYLKTCMLAADHDILYVPGADAILCIAGPDTDISGIYADLADLGVTAVLDAGATANSTAKANGIAVVAAGSGWDSVGCLNLTFTADGSMTAEPASMSAADLKSARGSYTTAQQTAYDSAFTSLQSLADGDEDVRSQTLFTFEANESADKTISFANYAAALYLAYADGDRANCPQDAADLTVTALAGGITELDFGDVTRGALCDAVPAGQRLVLARTTSVAIGALIDTGTVTRTYEESLTAFEPTDGDALVVTDTATLEALEQAGGSYTILRDYGDVFWDIRMNINDVTNNFANPFTLPEAPQRGAGRK